MSTSILALSEVQLSLIKNVKGAIINYQGVGVTKIWGVVKSNHLRLLALKFYVPPFSTAPPAVNNDHSLKFDPWLEIGETTPDNQ